MIILDRDGVINRDSDAFVKNADEWIAIDGSIEAIARLSQAGYTVAVATNQSGLGRGLFTEADLQAMHAKMQALVRQAGGRIDGIFYCPHTPDDQCPCRKPLPGLLDQIAAAYDVALDGVWMVGDALRDLQAGVARGCKPVLVKTGKGEKTLQQLREQSPFDTEVDVFNSLQDVANALLSTP